MADRRKLQADIERTLKRVQEGRLVFQETLDKFNSSNTHTQKEKFEDELKKQIKKLQRSREQIKAWQASSDIKDKRQLADARKDIESDMERFKVIERETKTKSYSKEGLLAETKIDPAQREREDIIQWIQSQIQSVAGQKEQIDFEIENLLNGKKRKVDKDKSDQIEEKREALLRHDWCTLKLEMVLRCLINEQLLVDQVKSIQDSVEYYVEHNVEPDFYHDDTIFDELNLDELADLPIPSLLASSPPPEDDDDVDDMDDEGHLEALITSSASPTPSATSRLSVDSNADCSCGTSDPTTSIFTVVGRQRVHSEPKSCPLPPPPQPSAAPEVDPYCSFVSATSSLDTSFIKELGGVADDVETSLSFAQTDVSDLHFTSDDVVSPYSFSTPLKSPIQVSLPEFIESDASVYERSYVAAAAAAAAAATAAEDDDARIIAEQRTSKPASCRYIDLNTDKLSMPPMSFPPHSKTGFTLQREHQHVTVPTDLISISHSNVMSNVNSRQLDLPMTLLSSSISSASASASLPRDLKLMASQAILPSNLSTAATSLQHISTTNPAANVSRPPGIISNIPSSPASSTLTGFLAPGGSTLNANNLFLGARFNLGNSRSQNSSGAPGRPESPTLVSFSLDPLLAMAPLRANSPPNKLREQSNKLESGLKKLPHPSDSERARPLYMTRVPVDSPSYYPQVPPGGMDTEELYGKLDPQTLFFIFYYYEGTRAQYLAAKSLKKQSWRFHTKYMMWFQRHEEPKQITDEYEQGTYVYHDFEKDSQRKKEGFTFEYKFLEDKEL